MNVDFSSFQAVLQWIIDHGYPLMFLAMCAEGPTVTAAATFATTLGYFSPLIVFALSIVGDVIPDMIFYAIGYFGRNAVVKKVGKRLGLTEKRLLALEQKVSHNGGKTVAVLKYTPILAAPGLMAVGVARMPFGRYLFYVVLVTLQKTATFMLIGYFFGKAYNVGKYIKFGAFVPFVIIVLYFLFAYLYKKYSERFMNKIEKI
ncbi:MAG TPA: VTT domain-containing protein [Patescibacteria group bacterium]